MSSRHSDTRVQKLLCPGGSLKMQRRAMSRLIQEAVVNGGVCERRQDIQPRMRVTAQFQRVHVPDELRDR